MKIIRLQSSNIMRLVAVDITPKGDLIIVGGKNGAGKSSVLNSIAMALGGAAMCPDEPIRTGESEAKITVELDDLIVTRRFERELVDDVPGAADATKVWSETTSTLVVTNKDGAQYPSPQKMLDRLLGKLTFDPLAFSREAPKTQEATLRALVGLDVSAIEAKRKDAYDHRAMLKKSYEIKAAQLLALPFHQDAPPAEIPLQEISDQMLKAEQLRQTADDADRSFASATGYCQRLEADCQRRYAIIEELRKRIDEETAAVGRVELQFMTAKKEMDSLAEQAQAAHAAVPDITAIRQLLTTTEATNVKVRANQQHQRAQAEVEAIARDIETKHEAVLKAEEEKRAALAAVKFPVEGLGISDDGVTFGGLPFAQASSSEQLRVSVAIGLALNPKLKVLLIRSGNLMDDDSLAAVAKQAEDASAQLWIEWVTANPEGVSVMIEEGKSTMTRS